MSIRKRVILLFGLLLLAFALARAPAWLVADASQKQLPGLVWQGVSGSLWQGRGLGVSYQFGDRRLAFEQLTWTLEPWPLLWGRLRFEVSAESPQQQFHGFLETGPNGVWRLQDAAVSVPVALFTGAGSPLNGQLALRIDELALRDESILALNGNGVWHGLRWQAGDYRVAPGDLNVALSEADGAALAEVQGGDADAALLMRIRVDLQGRYRLTADITPQPEAKAPWLRWLPALAPANRDGMHRFAQEGVLW